MPGLLDFLGMGQPTAQTPGSASVGGLLGGFGQGFNKMRTENPEALLALSAGLLQGDMAKGMAGFGAEVGDYRQDQRRIGLQREGWDRDDARFDKTFGLQQAQFGLSQQNAAFERNQLQAQTSAAAKYLESIGADPSLVELARAGQGAEAMKLAGAGGSASYGKTPVYGRNAAGDTVLGQLGDDGSFIATPMPEGVTPLSPYDTSEQRASGTALGKATGENAAAAPAAIQMADLINSQVESLKNDPALPRVLGPIDSRTPNFTTEAVRVQAKIDQLKGGAFLQARQMLKGGGAITDFEGNKAEAAFARMAQAQSVPDFNAALDEFNAAVQAGAQKLAQSAAGGVPGPAGGGAPDPLGIRR